MNYPKLADWIDEVAYQHFKQAYTHPTIDLNEYLRVTARANMLKGFALMFGQKDYSYYSRVEDEADYLKNE